VFLVRLLQRFEHFTLAEDKQLAPPWKTKPLPTGSSTFGPGYPGTKRKEVEKVWLGNHVVMFSKVSRLHVTEGWSWYSDPAFHRTGRNLGTGSQGFGVVLSTVLPFVVVVVHLRPFTCRDICRRPFEIHLMSPYPLSPWLPFWALSRRELWLKSRTTLALS